MPSGIERQPTLHSAATTRCSTALSGIRCETDNPDLRAASPPRCAATRLGRLSVHGWAWPIDGEVVPCAPCLSAAAIAEWLCLSLSRVRRRVVHSLGAAAYFALRTNAASISRPFRLSGLLRVFGTAFAGRIVDPDIVWRRHRERLRTARRATPTRSAIPRASTFCSPAASFRS